MCPHVFQKEQLFSCRNGYESYNLTNKSSKKLAVRYRYKRKNKYFEEVVGFIDAF
jgi:hypothetical protein